MTTGQMLKWTHRFNQILGAAQIFKQKRLNSMMNDLVIAYDAQDDYARCMYLAILEEMEV